MAFKGTMNKSEDTRRPYEPYCMIHYTLHIALYTVKFCLYSKIHSYIILFIRVLFAYDNSFGYKVWINAFVLIIVNVKSKFVVNSS